MAKSRGQGGRSRPRTAARLAAVQALYQAEQAGVSAEVALEEFVRHRVVANGPADFAATALEEGRIPGADVPLLAAIVRGWARDAEVLDRAIAASLAENWPMERLDPVLRAMLRAAAGELFDSLGPPAKVVINEYLDVAHGFFSGDEPRFANGVLDRLARILRPAEFADSPGTR